MATKKAKKGKKNAKAEKLRLEEERLRLEEEEKEKRHQEEIERKAKREKEINDLNQEHQNLINFKEKQIQFINEFKDQVALKKMMKNTSYHSEYVASPFEFIARFNFMNFSEHKSFVEAVILEKENAKDQDSFTQLVENVYSLERRMNYVMSTSQLTQKAKGLMTIFLCELNNAKTWLMKEYCHELVSSELEKQAVHEFKINAEQESDYQPENCLKRQFDSESFHFAFYCTLSAEAMEQHKRQCVVHFPEMNLSLTLTKDFRPTEQCLIVVRHKLCFLTNAKDVYQTFFFAKPSKPTVNTNFVMSFETFPDDNVTKDLTESLKKKNKPMLSKIQLRLTERELQLVAQDKDNAKSLDFKSKMFLLHHGGEDECKFCEVNEFCDLSHDVTLDVRDDLSKLDLTKENKVQENDTNKFIPKIITASFQIALHEELYYYVESEAQRKTITKLNSTKVIYVSFKGVKFTLSDESHLTEKTVTFNENGEFMFEEEIIGIENFTFYLKSHQVNLPVLSIQGQRLIYFFVTNLATFEVMNLNFRNDQLQFQLKNGNDMIDIHVEKDDKIKSEFKFISDKHGVSGLTLDSMIRKITKQKKDINENDITEHEYRELKIPVKADCERIELLYQLLELLL